MIKIPIFGVDLEAKKRRLSENYVKDIKIQTPFGAKCKTCQYRNTNNPELKSGFEECWKPKVGSRFEEFKSNSVFELWGGGLGSRSVVTELIEKNILFLKDVTEDMVAPQKNTEYIGLSPLERRMLQINKVKNNDKTAYLDTEGLKLEMDEWVWPLHFIDFETSMVAIPFNKGRSPYEGIAFQFSHHQVNKDGSIEHKGEFLSVEPGVFPNYEFVRELRNQLIGDEGTIFRYHNHENTFLLHIYRQLLEESKDVCPDKEELIEFIKLITHYDKETEWTGDRDMVDLYKLVMRYHYLPEAKGSNSIKAILPAVINDSQYLRNKYEGPVYGKEMSSLNFKEHIWIDESVNNNPYKTLPKLFQDIDEDSLDQIVKDMEDISDGGAALTAYAKLQFENIPNEQREEIKSGLLKYCELDTLAMVMIWEHWNQIIGK